MKAEIIAVTFRCECGEQTEVPSGDYVVDTTTEGRHRDFFVARVLVDCPACGRDLKIRLEN